MVFTCDLCAATFTRLRNLGCHLRDHTLWETGLKRMNSLKENEKVQETGQSYECNLCASIFSTFITVRGHLLTHVFGQFHRCDECPATFVIAHNLKMHKIKHLKQRVPRGQEQKPFRCQICFASFPYASHLQRHLGTHGGEKPYRCKFCSASFSRADGFERHFFRYHF